MGISKTSNLGRENGVEKRVGVCGEGVWGMGGGGGASLPGYTCTPKGSPRSSLIR